MALPQFSNGIGVQVANGMVAEDHQNLRVTAVDILEDVTPQSKLVFKTLGIQMAHLKLSTPQNQGSRMSSLIGLANNQLLQTTGKQTALGMARLLPDIRPSRNYVRPRDSNTKQLDVTALPLPSSLTEADLFMPWAYSSTCKATTTR